MNKLFRFFRIVFAAMLAFSLVSCGDGAGGGDNNQTPVAGDYTAENMTQYAGFVTDVSITANAGKSPGAISNIRYAGNTSVPQKEGSYKVTFDVAAVTGWEAATELSVGNLEVEARPDYGIVLDPAGSRNFGSVEAGYSAQTAHNVKVKNVGINDTGELTIALSGTDAASFSLSKTSISNIVAGESDNFTVVPKDGLSAATYTATVTVSGEDITEKSFNVSFTVTPITKTVSVGEQKGTLTAGEAGLVTFPITTTGIPNGTYTAKIPFPPKGISIKDGSVTISGGSGTLTLVGDTTTAIGTYNNLTLIIDSTESNMFSIKLSSPTGPKTVTVGAQVGIMVAGTEGMVTFPVTTTGIANGSYIATIPGLPTGIGISGMITINSGSGTLRLYNKTSALSGTVSLRLTIDSTQSNSFSFTISPVGTKSVFVEEQMGILTAGSIGEVRFPVKTAGITNGNYTATVVTLPSGVSVSGDVIIEYNSGTLILAGSSTTTACTEALTLTIDGTTSAAFTFTISGAVSSPFGGSGSEADPWIISSPSDLSSLANLINTGTTPYSNAGAFYKQSGKITLSGEWTPIGKWQYQFAGAYDGAGNEINGLITTVTECEAGLFGYIGSKGVVKNVKLTGISITMSGDGGGIAGTNEGSISNCFVTGSISGGAGIGGVAGNSSGIIENCYSAVTVSLGEYQGEGFGGIVGSLSAYNDNGGIVRNCIATGSVSGYHGVGGIAGSIDYYDKPTVENNVALNSSITASMTAYGNRLGRVYGLASAYMDNGALIAKNNYGRNDMIMDGPGYTAEVGEAKKDGVTVSSGQYNNQIWWIGTAKFDFSAEGPWDWDSVNNLPVLK